MIGLFSEIIFSQTGSRVLGNKSYEVSSHLGNVMTIVNDRKLYVPDNTNINVAHTEANIFSFNDYYPFGMLMENRLIVGDYRFSFQGQEKDNEVKGEGNTYTTMFRQYDSRVARWSSIDPLMSKYQFLSPYVAFNNSPIYFSDPNGGEGVPFSETYTKAVNYFYDKISFGSIYERFNNDFWEVKYLSNGKPSGYIRLKKDATPSEAIKDIYNNPELYNADCAEIIQISLTYSIMEVLGEDKFNESIGAREFKIGDHGSTMAVRYRGWNFFIVQGKKIMQRKYTDSEIKKGVDVWGDEIDLTFYEYTNSQIDKRSTIGSRLNFSNLDLADDKDFANENVTRTSEGFMAQGLNDNKPMNDLKAVILAYANVSYEDNKRDGETLSQYADRVIIINEIETYFTPQNSSTKEE